MTKRERVVAALGGQPVDRPPVAFWRHAPDVDHTAKGLAEAMLSFHRRFDLDLVKVMSSGVYCVEDWGCRVADTGAPSGAKQCVEHAVRAAADWARVRELDPGGGALGRELEAVRLIVRGRHDDAPVLHTVFTPLTIAKKLAGDRLRDDLRAAPAAVEGALETITRTMTRYANAALDAGAVRAAIHPPPRRGRRRTGDAHAAAYPRSRDRLRRAGGAPRPRDQLARPADAAHARRRAPPLRGRGRRRPQRVGDAPPRSRPRDRRRGGRRRPPDRRPRRDRGSRVRAAARRAGGAPGRRRRRRQEEPAMKYT